MLCRISWHFCICMDCVALTCGVDTSADHHCDVQQGNCDGANRVSQRRVVLNWSARCVLVRRCRIIASGLADILPANSCDLPRLAFDRSAERSRGLV